MACAGRRQRQAQAKRCDDPLAPTKPRLFATGVEQRFRKHPLELVRDHAKLSRIHLRLLSLSFKQHAQEEFRMDRNKNPQQNQILNWTLAFFCCLTLVHTENASRQEDNRSIWPPP